MLLKDENLNISATNEIIIENLVKKICKFINYKYKIIKKFNRTAYVKSPISSNKKI